MSDGVLLMGFGGPESLADVPAFCANLMGREPAPDVLARVTRRYLTIGGGSPLLGVAQSIGEKLRDKLAADGKLVPLKVGMRYSPPFIGDAVAALVDEGVDRLVTVSLSPFESSHSSGAYRQAVAHAAAFFPDLTVVEAASIRTQRRFLDVVAAAADDALRDVAGGRKALVFTAHSLPTDEIADDPYVAQLHEAANGIAVLMGLSAAVGAKQEWLPGISAFGAADPKVPWLLAYQSKGQRPGKWLGPDVNDVVRALGKAGFEGVVFSPVGFAIDNMETMYDLDVEACGLAVDLGMDYQRAVVPNDTEDAVSALAGVVQPLLK